MTRNKKFASRKVKDVHICDISMDTDSIDLCETHEGWQSLCQSLRWCLPLSVIRLSFLIRGGRVWKVLTDSSAGPSGKSVSLSQKRKSRQEVSFLFYFRVCQESHFPVTFLVSYFLVFCPSFSSFFIFVHYLCILSVCDLAHWWNE